MINGKLINIIIIIIIIIIMPGLSQLPWFDNSDSSQRVGQIMMLLIMQLRLTFCCFFPLKSKYSPQHTVLIHPYMKSTFTFAWNKRQDYGFTS